MKCLRPLKTLDDHLLSINDLTVTVVLETPSFSRDVTTGFGNNGKYIDIFFKVLLVMSKQNVKCCSKISLKKKGFILKYCNPLCSVVSNDFDFVNCRFSQNGDAIIKFKIRKRGKPL